MKKIKIAGIILAALAILIAAFLTVSGIRNKSAYLGGVDNLNEDSLSTPRSRKLGSAISDSSTAPLGLESTESAMESTPENPISLSDKKIIKNGNLNLKVNSVSDAAEKISEIAKNNSGEIISSSITQSKNNIKKGNITVKVAFANFEKTISEIKKIATLVIQESATGQDVTEEYADLQAQIKNKQAEEQAYIKIFDQAQKIQDILDVTRQLSIVRGQIESLQGRLKFMENQTSMSTISISLSEDQNITITDSWRPLQIAKDAFNSLIKMSQGFISFLIILVVTVIPVAILYLLLAFMIYLIAGKIYRKIKKRNENNIAQNQKL
jgi:hypothetical protein